MQHTRLPLGALPAGRGTYSQSNPCPLSSCPADSVPGGAATHTSLTPQPKWPIRATARTTQSPGSILSILPLLLPSSGTSGEGEPRAPLRKAIACDADTFPERIPSPLPRPSPFPSARPPCGTGEGSSDSAFVARTVPRCRTTRPLESGQPLCQHQHRKVAASCCRPPCAGPRASPGSWLPRGAHGSWGLG